MARQNPQDSVRRHRRRRRGVPKALAVVLIIVALVVGGGLGYFANRALQGGQLAAKDRQIDEKDALIAESSTRIQKLEMVLKTMDIDPDEEFFDALNPLVKNPEADALAGNTEGLPVNDALIVGGDQLAVEPDASEAAPVVVAEFGDVKIMSDEVLAAYNAKVNQLMIIGQDVTQYADSLMEDTLTSIVTEKLKYQKAEEFGLTALTEADNAAIDKAAQEEFDALIEFYIMDDEALTPEQERQAAVAHLAEEDGVTLESMRAEIERDWWDTKLSDYVSKDVVVTDEALQETYDRYLEDQQSLYATNPEDYEFARRSGEETVVYNPEGYRAFKQVLIAFDQEDSFRVEEILWELNALDPATDAEDVDALNGELDILYAKLQPTADEVLDRIAQGDDFDALIAEYGQDPEQNEPAVKREGYYVSENSTSYVLEIVQAAMALQKAGEVSEPVRTVAGLHILRYNSDVPAGPVALETVREALTAEALESLKYDAYDAQLAKWVEEANITYHREALQ
ncbi:MAG: hypothetical protein GX592_09510 [Clostridiales bacterium]|nr:hypothetical protein [Clostridiales bacterium]